MSQDWVAKNSVVIVVIQIMFELLFNWKQIRNSFMMT